MAEIPETSPSKFKVPKLAAPSELTLLGTFSRVPNNLMVVQVLETSSRVLTYHDAEASGWALETHIL